MIVYHGSNVEIDKIDFTKCLPYKDFGKGFHTTLLEEQAWRIAGRRTRTKGGIPVVTVFEVPDDIEQKGSLNVKRFPDKPTVEWAVFIRNNRSSRFTDISSAECNTDNKYDIVIGPVANDTIGVLLRQFDKGIIDEERLKKEFDFGTLTNQITFHTDKALGFLTKVGVKYGR